MGMTRTVPQVSWQADIPSVQEMTMTYGALALYLGAVLFRGPGLNSGNGHGGEESGGEESEVSERRADRGLYRYPVGDPALVEDDYYRFLNQPRG
jgi:hypothetical protein